ncbi:unnamed protein product [Bursaphelenchus xylophilus]|uniref:(pine wood nematode) hypothetical protein n=1 Tax=Bursaphelenchus xylophilus TaxID=6326 RepID=A0A1I7SQ01_BURXY|nr:unnamed protein product [Bursaphelenchus xylophilus]CAG9109428.1 unnamed protein product [Bursaphelenchus xylophilus]
MEQLPDSGLRQRRKLTVDETIKSFDAFNKVVDSVQEEKTATNGVITICSFALILILCGFQLCEYYYNDDVEYKFSVDTNFDERPNLDIDMIVNTPCGGLTVMVVSHSSAHKRTPEDGIRKEPTRFEMEPNEQSLWSILQAAHKEQFKPGTKLKALNDMSYVSSSVESGLRDIAKDKVKEEEIDIKKQRAANGNKGHGHGQVVMMIGNGMGMFQLISANGGNEGHACRLVGKVPVLKGDDDRIVISSSNVINFGPFMGELDNGAKSNFSHRIERFHFGDHVWGLVTPLAGTEKFSQSGGTMYKYFVKVVPTRIVGFLGKSITYQYSVTSMQREPQDSGHIGSGITFVYEFAGNVIDVYPTRMGLIQLLLRLCSVIGGVFATSIVIQTIVSNLIQRIPYTKL